ncbi:hypothetical protein ANO14919_000950 [Xylariales sp. No.14919]|nr:hypothetical protein ANO14919_000950 [Xylariales sp. No.14919]
MRRGGVPDGKPERLRLGRLGKAEPEDPARRTSVIGPADAFRAEVFNIASLSLSA